MNRRILAAGLLALTGSAVSASGVVTPVFGTGFEAPDYVPGQLTGQQGWLFFGSGSPPQSSVTVVNNPANAQSGNQYVQVATGSFGGTSSQTRTTFSYHADPVSAATIGGGVLHLRSGIRIDSASSTRITGAEMQAYDPAITVIMGSAGLQSNTTLNEGPLFVFGNNINSIGITGAVLNTWYTFDIYMDYGTSLMYYYVNGVDFTPTLIGFGFDNSFDNTVDYGEIDLASSRFNSPGTTATGNHRYDNILIEYGDIDIPSPGAGALLTLGGLLAARRRRS